MRRRASGTQRCSRGRFRSTSKRERCTPPPPTPSIAVSRSVNGSSSRNRVEGSSAVTGRDLRPEVVTCMDRRCDNSVPRIVERVEGKRRPHCRPIPDRNRTNRPGVGERESASSLGSASHLLDFGEAALSGALPGRRSTRPGSSTRKHYAAFAALIVPRPSTGSPSVRRAPLLPCGTTLR